MLKVTFDIACEGKGELEVATQEAEAKGAKLTVLQECGPGGGWPEVQLEGDDTAVLDQLREWGFELEDVLIVG
mgnify:CR=1 FL=1